VHRYSISIALVLGVAGCYEGRQLDGEGATLGSGASGNDDAGNDDAGDDEGDDGEAPIPGCEEPKPGTSPLRRLTAFEYDNTVADLLGDTTKPGRDFPAQGGSGFDNNADVGSVTRIAAEKYMAAAETLSANAVADLPGLLGCDPSSDESACVRGWIETFGARAWRRPLENGEVDDMVALYDDARGGRTVAAGVEVVLQAFLESPFFLYRVEFGATEAGPDAVHLDDFEMATRLSYFLWGSMPDDDLFAAAEAGELQTKDQVEAHARRMLDDPRTHRMAIHFYEQWLGFGHLAQVSKDPAAFPEWDGSIGALQQREAEAFVEHVLWQADGKLSTLLTAPYTFANAELAEFYGIEPAPGSGFQRVEDARIEHAGILTQGGILTVHAKADQTSPVARGLFVRQQLLCTPPPPPPDDVDIRPPEVDPDATTRERFAMHRENPACAGCHNLMDPLGFSMEHFDGVGRWRDEENDKPIDATGKLVASDVDGEFDGAADLASMLAQSDMVRECVTRNWFRYAYGRAESEDNDECALAQLDQAFAAGDHDLKELLVALTQTDAFMYRPGGEP
jgi:hypothetical protein